MFHCLLNIRVEWSSTAGHSLKDYCFSRLLGELKCDGYIGKYLNFIENVYYSFIFLSLSQLLSLMFQFDLPTSSSEDAWVHPVNFLHQVNLFSPLSFLSRLTCAPAIPLCTVSIFPGGNGIAKRVEAVAVQ